MGLAKLRERSRNRQQPRFQLKPRQAILIVMQLPVLAISFAALLLAGCQSVHTAREDGVPVAVWSSMLMLNAQGEAGGTKVRDTVARGHKVRDSVAQVLKEAGLHATVDERGVSVPE